MYTDILHSAYDLEWYDNITVREKVQQTEPRG